VMDEDALMPVKPRAKKRVSLRVTAD